MFQDSFKIETIRDSFDNCIIFSPPSMNSTDSDLATEILFFFFFKHV